MFSKPHKKLQKELDIAYVKMEQYQLDSERKDRNHRPITRGADVESVAPEVRSMSQSVVRSDQMGVVIGMIEWERNRGNPA